MARDRYRFGDASAPHFLTCTVVGWLPLFARPELAEVVLDSWRYLVGAGRIELIGYVVMEDHVHFVAASRHLNREVGDFKSFTARAIVDRLEHRGARGLLDQLAAHKLDHKADRRYQVWQEGSHPQQIADEAMLRQKLEYVHANPVRRGYVDDPVHWRYSSARNYARGGGMVPVQTDW